MKLEKVRISNYRCFGKEPVTIEFDDLTGLIGHNSSGKTALLTALQKMFSDRKADRIIERSDFYIPRNKNPDEIEVSEFFIETYFTFDDSFDKNDANAIDIPSFFTHFIVDEPKGNPYIRIRLDASWEKSSNPEGIIESSIYYVTTGNEYFNENDCYKARRQDLEKINIIYIPAIRKPDEQLKNVSGSIMYRLLNSIKLSDESKKNIEEKAESVESAFLEEESIKLLGSSLNKQWKLYHRDEKYSNTKMNFSNVDLNTMLKKVEVTFSPTETNRSFKSEDLGDGLRSLFYISIVDTMLEIEEKISKDIIKNGNSDCFDLDPPILTILAVEEPENHISPQILGRVIDRVKNISFRQNSQAIITSHSPSIVKRIDPSNIRYFRNCSEYDCSKVKALTLPDKEKGFRRFKYIKEAVRAYPELYFAKLVVLGEGDSEEIIIRKMLELKGTEIDSAEIAIVPLGGRHVNHFWRLLNDLNIPFITLLDLDRERDGGGWGRIKYALTQLIKNGENRDELLLTTNGILSEERFNTMHTWANYEYIDGWIKNLEKYDVYFSSPLDIDFAMLSKFEDEYIATLSDNEGPMIKEYGKIHKPNLTGKDANKYKELLNERIQSDLRATLKAEGGEGKTYSDEEKELMIWYNYFFLNRGKPTTHRVLFNENVDIKFEDFPECLKNFVEGIINKLN